MKKQLKQTLEQITRHASIGTLKQFHTMLEAKLENTDYTAEMNENHIRCYRVTKQGGFLGFGAKTIREPVMEIAKKNGVVEIAPEPLDPRFARFLADRLEQR